MNKKELKSILSNFSMTAGAQLKYYIIRSIFPEAKLHEIEDIGGFNSKTFSSIYKGVEEKELKLLQVTQSEEILETEVELAELESLKAELTTLKEENEKLKYNCERLENRFNLKSCECSINIEAIQRYKFKLGELRKMIQGSESLLDRKKLINFIDDINR